MSSSLKTASFVVLAALVAATGCSSTRPQVCSYVPPGPARGVVIALDGSGDYQRTSAALRDAIADQGLPLRVESYDWSHGRGRVLADEVDYAHAQEEGRALAENICTIRQTCPNGEIYLVAHSAGSAVALATAENLPPDTLTRVVLLAPAVSADYDLRPALRACRQGIDTFSSSRDIWVLGLGTGIVGTTDRRWSAPAGRVGFHPVEQTPDDSALYSCKLRQHEWDPAVAWTGNSGGHYGAYRPAFLRAYVLPLLH